MLQTTPCFTAAQVREIDRRAMADLGLSDYALMQRAARAALRVLQREWPAARSLALLAGPGNNGGDAIEVARLARAAGYRVRLHLLGDPAALKGAAGAAWAAAQRAGLAPEAGPLQAADVLVDGLFGSGLSRPPEGQAAQWIEALARLRAEAGCGVLALDVPSGLSADDGRALGTAVQADHTVSFVARKVGLDLGAAIDACGQVHFADCGARAALAADLAPAALRLDGLRWPARRRGAHKGDSGHVLCVGGAPQYAGALVLAARAALRAGAGKVSLLGHTADNHPTQWPEMMRVQPDGHSALLEAAAGADALCLGPGLGRDEEVWGRLALLRRAPAQQVWDADALWALSQRPQLRPKHLLLTPHPGEAGLLLGRKAAEVQADRLQALADLVARWECPVILKGARTLVGAPGHTPLIVPQGHPGMAVGGMGDALAGIVAALCAQGLAAYEAAAAGAWWLAATSDALRAEQGASLLPQDVIDALGRLRA